MATSTDKSRLRHIRTLLISNRGEIAVRAIKACRELGVRSVAVLTHTDATSLHATLADEAIVLPGDDSSAYTNGNAILEICKQTKADAIFPGYGFLSENTEFADAATAAGITFVGPSADSIRAMGLKHEARALAEGAGVPVIPGTSLLQSQEHAVAEATRLGFPVMLKATGGGGGMGMQICATAEEVASAWANVESRAATLFKNSGVFMERYFPRARHVEVQVAGNGDGTVVAFGERECSLQRRHQKVVEETPSPFVVSHPGLRERMITAAISYAAQLHYKSVGTVEFLVDDDTADFFFLEMNTRLQVEHGISELRYGVDLVHLMLRQADFERGGAVGLPAEELKSLVRQPSPDDCAIEVRVYAEAPLRDFAPTPGLLQNVVWPKDDGKNSTPSVRVDTWVQSGQRISPLYDPLVSKIMVFSPKGREDARHRMLAALSATKLQGTQTNLEYLSALVGSDLFATGQTLTSSLDSFTYESCSMQVIDPGVATTVQDHPGRTSIGHGVPPGGPMDDMSARIANLLVGNETGTEHLEILLSGPELLFHSSAVVSVCGAALDVTVDNSPQPMWSRIVIAKGQTLKLGRIGKGASVGGLRAYLAVKGGFPEVASFLGSKATAPELGFGGVQGRKLQRHDTLTLRPVDTSGISPISLPEAAIPRLQGGPVTIHCMDGPYNSDDIVTPKGRETLCSSTWTVGRDSGRSGVRLSGPKLAWARASGGGGGSHPSNVFEYGYPYGGVNFTGEAPIIFAKDGPDLGGFVCPITVCSGSMWKVGQLRPGDSVRFNTLLFDDAVALLRAQLSFLADVKAWVSGDTTKSPAATVLDISTTTAGTDWSTSAAILHQSPAVNREDGTMLHPKVTYRQGGDSSIMVEYGEQTADLHGTAFVHRLAQQLSDAVSSGRLQGVRGEPNFGSLTVRFNALLTDRADLLAQLIAFDADIQSGSGSEVSIQTQMRMPTRRIRLPVCLDHTSLSASAKRYMDSIRPTAAYLPDNVAYLAENNALKSRESVFDALLKTPWLVVAVGFYVGTPIMFPLDPWRVMVGQKYSPSRVHTPGGTVGLGGSLLAVYPVDSPGGYQMMGRTLGGWDASGNRPGFTPGRPWLFTPLDVVEFYEVPEPEFDQLWRDYESGRYHFDISADDGKTLDLGAYIAAFDAAARDPAYQEWRRTQAVSTASVSRREQKLYDDWTAEKNASALANGNDATAAVGSDDDEDDDTVVKIESPMDANVWKVLVKPGDILAKGQTVAVLEAMKMEINLVAEDSHVGAVVTKVSQPPGSFVSPGTIVIRAKKAD